MGFKRGNVYLIKFSPGKGAEPEKIITTIIFQSQDLLDIGYKTVIVIPLTTNLKGDFPLRVRISKRDKLEKDSNAMIDQIRAIDSSRIYREIIAVLTNQELKQIEESICIVTGIEI